LDPSYLLGTCASNLRKWLHGSGTLVLFAVPLVWREQTDHITDCYLCLTNVKGFPAKSKHAVQYPNFPSAIRPVPHDGFPIPVPPQWDWTSADEGESTF